MPKSMALRGAIVLALVTWASGASACGDKFLVPARGPNVCALNRPPHQIAVLIYGNPSSAAVSTVSSAEYRKTLTKVGYKVTTCTGSDDCVRELKDKKFDVVLADAKDAKTLKEQTGSNVLPVLTNASKEEVKEAKAAYGHAFDTSSGSLKLLTVINRAASAAPER